MAKGGQLELPLISAGDRPPTVLQIFQEAAKLLRRSWKLMLPILLIFLLPDLLLFVGNYFTATRLIMDLVNKLFAIATADPRRPEFQKLLQAALEDLRKLTAAEVVIILISHLLSFPLFLATVSTISMASKGEQTTLKDLLSKIKRTWKGALATHLYVSIMNSGYMATLFMLVGAILFVSNGSMALYALGAVVSIVGYLPVLYLEMVWQQGLVISVAEEDCYGLAALGRASELVMGRRRLGFRVNGYFVFTAVIFFMASNFVISYLPGETTQLVVGLITTFFGLVLIVFMLAVYVVFYYECKKSRGEGVAVIESLGYTWVIRLTYCRILLYSLVIFLLFVPLIF